MNPVVERDMLTILAGLFEEELGFPKDPPRVFVYNQKWKIPSDSGAFLVVSFRGSRTIGAGSATQQDPQGNLVEYQSVNRQESYQVDLFSRDSSAELREWELTAALRSVRAQQLCDQYAFKIGYTSASPFNVPDLEGMSQLNRYAAVFNVIYAHQKTKIVESFDAFPSPTLLIER